MRVTVLRGIVVFAALVGSGCSGNGMSPSAPGAGGSAGRGGAAGSAAGATGSGGSWVDPCSGSSVDGSVTDVLACAASLPPGCHLQGWGNPNGCTLDDACGLCAPLDGGGGGCPQSKLVEGTMYDYIQIYDVDVAAVLVYDKRGMLVAQLSWGANASEGMCPWTCLAGPANFDATEAVSFHPGLSSGHDLSLSSVCAARAHDAASD